MRDGSPSRNLVFISYAHRDDPRWLRELQAHVGALGPLAPVEAWSDERIQHGQHWLKEINIALKRARFAVCLVSAQFLSSRFCREYEIPELLRREGEGGLEILPVLVQPCAWRSHAWIAARDLRPKGNRSLEVDYPNTPSVVFSELAEHIRRSLEGKEPRPAPSPPRHRPRVQVDKSRLPALRTELLGRHSELDELHAALGFSGPRVLVFHGWSGIGKTTLVSRWIEIRETMGFGDAELVFAHQFSNQGARNRETSPDEFLATALERFGDGAPYQGTPWDQGERLAGLVANRRGVLVLDGLEPIQTPAGALKHPSLLALFRRMARSEHGLIVVTSQRPLSDLEGPRYEETVRQISLDEVSPEVGRSILRVNDIEGTDADLDAVVTRLGRQVLAVSLFARWAVATGHPQIAHFDRLPQEEPTEVGGASGRVMRALALHLGECPERQLLRVLTLFERPAASRELDALLAAPLIPGLTDLLGQVPPASFMRVCEQVRELGLLTYRREGTYDLHPSVRRFFSREVLRDHAASVAEGHRRLFRLFTGVSGISGMSPKTRLLALQGVEHGCLAGCYQAAFDAFQAVSRVGDVGQGGFGADLSTLGGFFSSRWGTVVTDVSMQARGTVLERAGECLQALGRVDEALEPLRERYALDLDGRDANRVSLSAEALSTAHLVLGQLAEARDYAVKSVEAARATGDQRRLIYALARAGDIAQLLDQMDISEREFEEAEREHAKLDPNHPRLRGVVCFWRCDLDLARARREIELGTPGPALVERVAAWLDDARARAEQALRWDPDSAFESGLNRLVLGESQALRSLAAGVSIDSSVLAVLDQGIEGLRASERQNWLPRGLIVRARLRRAIGRLSGAEVDIDESLDMATMRGPKSMKLHLADALLEQTALLTARHREDEAQRSMEQARALVEEMGFRSRTYLVGVRRGSLRLNLGEPS